CSERPGVASSGTMKIAWPLALVESVAPLKLSSTDGSGFPSLEQTATVRNLPAMARAGKCTTAPRLGCFVIVDVAGDSQLRELIGGTEDATRLVFLVELLALAFN